MTIAREMGQTSNRLRAVNVLAGAESDGSDVAGCDSGGRGWLVALSSRVHRGIEFGQASSGGSGSGPTSCRWPPTRWQLSGSWSPDSDVPPPVRLRASLAILRTADALKAEEVGPTTAEGVQANIEHKRFIDSLG